MGLMKALLGGEQTYEEGLAEGRKSGILDTLAALDGTGDPHKPGRYSGPVPPELREWCAAIRARLAQ